MNGLSTSFFVFRASRLEVLEEQVNRWQEKHMPREIVPGHITWANDQYVYSLWAICQIKQEDGI